MLDPQILKNCLLLWDAFKADFRESGERFQSMAWVFNATQHGGIPHREAFPAGPRYEAFRYQIHDGADFDAVRSAVLADTDNQDTTASAVFFVTRRESKDASQYRDLRRKGDPVREKVCGLDSLFAVLETRDERIFFRFDVAIGAHGERVGGFDDGILVIAPEIFASLKSFFPESGALQ